jgi:tetratricopeptide (TPR) repeat protein
MWRPLGLLTVMGRVAALTLCLMLLAVEAAVATADDLAVQHARNAQASAKLIDMGDDFLRRHDSRGAIGMYERALVADPASAVALRKLGIAYKSAKLYTDAMKYCRMSLALEPDNVEGLACQGVGAANREEFELAVENLHKIKDLCQKSCPEYKELRRALKENFPVRFRRLRD